jgi:pimeloyl-ACP methyl ester carboxylesterase
MPKLRTSVSSSVCYRKLGAGPAIILLHGFPASGVLWHNVWDDLAESYTVIVPDFPGTGQSALDGNTSITGLAQIVKEIMDSECVDKAIIAGHSMGGYVAFEFARLYPHRVAGLSLVHSTPLSDDQEKVKTRLKSIALIQNGGKNAFVTQMIPNLFSPAFKLSDPLIINAQIDDSLQVEDKGLINFYKAMIARHDNSEVLGAAIFPVQWICGLDDVIIPYKKILDKYHVSDTNFVSFYDNCGHMSMLEAPTRLIVDLKEFAGYCYNYRHR